MPETIPFSVIPAKPVVALANLGSVAGTFIGGAKIIQLFINIINP